MTMKARLNIEKVFCVFEYYEMPSCPQKLFAINC